MKTKRKNNKNIYLRNFTMGNNVMISKKTFFKILECWNPESLLYLDIYKDGNKLGRRKKRFILTKYKEEIKRRKNSTDFLTSEEIDEIINTKLLKGQI